MKLTKRILAVLLTMLLVLPLVPCVSVSAANVNYDVTAAAGETIDVVLS